MELLLELLRFLEDIDVVLICSQWRRFRNAGELLNDRNSQMDLRHASEYDKLGQDWDWRYATFLSGP